MGIVISMTVEFLLLVSTLSSPSHFSMTSLDINMSMQPVGGT